MVSVSQPGGALSSVVIVQAAARGERMIYVFGAYTLDTQRYELRHVGVLCKLEPQVFNVLAYLLEHHTRVVSKDELLEQCWPQQFVNDVNVNQRVMAARKVLGDNGRVQRYIKTAHGRGYRFVADVTLVESALVAPSPTAAMAMVPPAPPGLATLPPRLPETFSDPRGGERGRR
jgi:DNA-binding winged helix-turn-helix (wHTH) protein